MGKSPAKWIKTVLLGKKSSKSNLSKDATSEIKTSLTGKTTSNDFGADSMVISSPVRPVTASTGEHTELEKSSSVDDSRIHMDLNASNNEELIKLEQAAVKAQSAFKGYLARRAFRALKGIIRLQALVRGHLVRRQAIVTLKCMRAIIELQALARGRVVRLTNGQVAKKHTSTEFIDKKASNLLETSLRVEKLSTNVFVNKLVASSHTMMPLSIRYEPMDPNSVTSWLTRWSSSGFWVPLSQPKKPLDAKPKRKQTKLQTEEIEKPKRSVRRGDKDNSFENEKSKRTVRKVNPQTDSGQDQSVTELEKVKRSLRKISVSTSGPPEKSEPDAEKTSPDPELSDKNDSVNDSSIESLKPPELAESLVQPPVEEKPVDQPATESPDSPNLETLEPAVNGESNGKETQKARRRKSLPAKQEPLHESVVPQSTPALPSYMAATESAKAKLRAQAAAKAAEEGGEVASARRQSLPSAGKPSLASPRVQKPLQANGKAGSKPKKAQISPRDEKVIQGGWKR